VGGAGRWAWRPRRWRLAVSESPFPPEAFDREDETSDRYFYEQPRFVEHIDEYAIAAVSEAYRQFLRPGGEYLDLMSSWVSHFPSGLAVGRLVGLGLNEAELRRNPALDDYVVHDLNRDPRLPFEDSCFDGVVICVSVQYLTHPVEVFQDIGRVLKPRAPLIVTFSNRCFPTKAVWIWRALGDDDHVQLIDTYLEEAGGFEVAQNYDFSPRHTFYGVPDDADLRSNIASGLIHTDPLYVVVAHRL
jgi:SAM-dependent methyltransferase